MPEAQGPAAAAAADLDDDALAAIPERYWETGGARFIGTIGDTLIDARTNARVAGFVRQRIRRLVDDPVTADARCPTSGAHARSRHRAGGS